MVVPALFVQPVGVEAQIAISTPRVRQLAKVVDFGFVGYFEFEESVVKHVVEGRRNMILSPFEWLMLGNLCFYFELKD